MPPGLQTFLAGITLADIITWLIAAGVVWAGVKWVVPFIKKSIDFFDDVAGEPARPGFPERPGLMSRMATVETALAQVKHEVLPNTGTSARDAIDRTEKAVTDLQSGMDDVHSKLDNDNQRITGLSDRLEEHITQSTQIINKLTKEDT